MIRTLLVVLAIPAIGLLIATWILGDLNGDMVAEGLPTVQEICKDPSVAQDPELAGACTEVGQLVLLQKTSIYTGLFGLGILFLFWMLSKYAGSNRRRLATIFPPLVRVSMISISAIVLVQGIILTYAAYIGEVYAIGRIHYFLIGAIGIGAFIACMKLIGIAFTYGKKVSTSVSGRVLSKEDFPDVHQHVQNIASTLGSRAPDNIVAGLDLNFFVTSADVNLTGTKERLEGETLYLSTPLCRILSVPELSAVIGHELGHFRGEDTAYSLKFSPVYMGLSSAIHSTSVVEDEGITAFAKLPALSMLSLMYSLFSENEKTVGRQREFEADQAGCEVTSPINLASALVKISMYSGLWPEIQKGNIERLSEGKITSNLARVFSDQAKFDIKHQKLVEVLPHILEKRISHPTDTHPSTGHRIEKMGITSDELQAGILTVPSESAYQLINEVGGIEEELTIFEHQMMVALGLAEVPAEDEKQGNNFLNAIYMLAASVVAADGAIDSDEIATAESIGRGMFSDFDPIDFRELCRTGASGSQAIEIATILSEVLEESQKAQILNYLNDISAADGDVSEEEERLIKDIADALG